MLRHVFISLLAACSLHALAQSAATARLGALGRNDTVVTSVTFGGPAMALTDGTNIITSARDVFRILAEDEPWSYTVSPAFPAGTSITVVRGETYGFSDSYWAAGVDYPGGGGPYPLGGDASSTNLTLTSHFDVAGPEYTVIFTRHIAGETNYVGRLALTNELPKAGAEWAVGTTDGVICWTNGMIDVSLPHDDLQAVTNGWPDGASVFVRLHAAAQYIVHPPLRLVGYAAWPTNEAEAVAWRSGTNVFVNVIRIGE